MDLITNRTTARNRHWTAPVLSILLFSMLVIGQGTKITPPKNGYSASDDVKLGQEAAAQVRREMPILPDSSINAYVGRVGDTLVAAIPPEFAHSEFRYEFSVVNASDINAFALPGGPMFVNRGMIEAAHTEAEMAGVMAHELSHVALRHGTAQASKSQNPGILLGGLGGAIAGAIIGGNLGDVISQGTQIGLGTYMLKFSREYETQADVLGAQIMARAGYDPRELGNMFKTIEQQGGSGGPEWLSDHPNPGNRYERINQEASRLSIAPKRRNGEAEFVQTQSALKRMPPAKTMSDIAKSNGPATNRPTTDTPVSANPERPSGRYRTFTAQSFRLSLPDNWKEYADSESVTFAPTGGYGTYQNQSVFTHGAIVGVVNVSSNDLASVTDQYIAGVLQENVYLQVNGNAQRTALGGRDALKRTLKGNSPVTRRQEFVVIHTSMISNRQLFYMVQVVPGNERNAYNQAFTQMVRTLTFS